MTTGILEDIQSELEIFFDDLNWTYIFIYIMVLYGIKHKEEFNWYNKMLSGKYLNSFKVWISGLIVACLFSIFRALGEDPFHSEYVSQLLRSWIIVIVFNSVFSDRIRRYEKKDKDLN